MKNILLLFSTLMFTLISCEGPQGPPGVPGPEGIPGRDANEEITTVVIEEVVDFNSTNNFAPIVPLINGVAPTDTVLVYRGFNVGDNNDILVWEPLPNTIYTDAGSFQYVFNYNEIEVELAINSSFEIAQIDSRDLTGQLFKFVIIPTRELTNVDISNFEEVQALLP